MQLRGASLLSPEDIARIHETSLSVLEKTGVQVLNDRGLQLLKSAGAVIDNRTARIPRELVERAIEQAPSSVTVYDRNGNPAMELQGRNSYFGAGGPAPYYYDEEAHGFRPFLLADCARVSRVCDACQHLDFDMAMAHCSDVSVGVRDLCEVAVMIRHSSKPIVFTANSPENVIVLAEIFQAAKGDGSIAERPYGIFYTEPISPLTHAPDSLDKVWVAVDRGFPLLYTSAPMAGATGPATLAGNLVVGNAEWLSGLVMTQLYKPGAPVIYGGVFANIDYRTCILPYGSPELQLQTFAVAEMGRYYHIPSFGTAGCSDASAADEQNGFESGLSILLNLQSGANLIHDVGWFTSANATSAEQLVICDEMIAQCRRLMAGITVDESTLALDVIDAVGPGGSFLARDHTIDHFRHESFFSDLWDRRPINKRLGGDSVIVDRACEAVRQIITNYKPALMSTTHIQAVGSILADRCAGVDENAVRYWREETY